MSVNTETEYMLDRHVVFIYRFLIIRWHIK